ncbi:uncharacterized protein LOC124252777 [Haliotis rubra]|uniref:uncharacterized protein LOC124252777 n=1 Tax=Haliotis rubra TaxID=36100 RepID=UPI001EE6289C|nr:uncharacterized protein LOC124252777 [Haliotis rubra]
MGGIQFSEVQWISGTYLFYLELDVFTKNAYMFVFTKKSGGLFKSAGYQEAGDSAVAVRHQDKGEEVGVIPEQPNYYYTTPAHYFGEVTIFESEITICDDFDVFDIFRMSMFFFIIPPPRNGSHHPVKTRRPASADCHHTPSQQCTGCCGRNLTENTSGIPCISASKTVSFHVWRPSADARTSSAGYAPLTFNRMDINAGSGYNMTAGTFTAPVSGTYLFYLEVEVFTKNAYMFVFTKKSGGVFKSVGVQEAGVAAVAVRHLDKWEEVGVIPEQSSYYYATPAQIFGGVLLKPD